MTWIFRPGWLALSVATLGLAVASFVYEAPELEAALVVDRALVQRGAAGWEQTRLPYRGSPEFEPAEIMNFVVTFDREAAPSDGVFALIPHLNRPVEMTLNGHRLFDGSMRILWSGPLVGTPILMHFPSAFLVPGRNELRLEIELGHFGIPPYLSKIYIDRMAALAPDFKLGLFIDERLKTMALAAQVLLAIGVLLIFSMRPKEPLFAWLAAMTAMSLVLSFGLFLGFEPVVQDWIPYLAVLAPTLGFVAIGVAFVITGRPAPRIVLASAIAISGFTVLQMLAGIAPNRAVASLFSIPMLIATFAIATAIIAFDAFRRENTEARLMMWPFFLITCLLIRDTGVSIGLLDLPVVILAPYARPVVLVAIVVVLMRRLVKTLDLLDSANETLNRRLAEQEAELALLHRAERVEAARQVREQERQRLTRDLHDGISGHLVSIIAMTERAGGESEPIEQAARRALEDLRLVIYSLDLGEHDLPLALANFRERLIPQLQRIGVELDWSMAELPEISGVTPGNALVVLRILQEAITNALKHGPARKIAIRGSLGPDGMAAITVENDGRRFAPGSTGHGLANMGRRARQLGGTLQIDSLEQGVRLTLSLPLSLPDFTETDERHASDGSREPESAPAS